MQLTKDDVKPSWICMSCSHTSYTEMKKCPVCKSEIIIIRKGIDEPKFQQVVAFYEEHTENGIKNPPNELWKQYVKYHLEHKDVYWRDWLFKHCFVDGLR